MNHQTGVLISSISKKVPLIEAVRKASKQLSPFMQLHGCDCDKNCLAQYFVDVFWNCPPLEQSNVDQMLKYCLENRIQTIIPTRNGELEHFARHHELFKSQGVHVMVSPLEAIQNCLDKKLFADHLKANQFNAIPSELSPNSIEASYYVVKERFGAGSLNIAVKLSKERALEYAQKLQYPLFQPYIEGYEYSVDLYRGLSGQVLGCVARRRDLIVDGESQVTTTEKKPILERLCSEAAQALQLYGHVVFQALESDDQNFHLIECNPRFGGASTASIAAGLDSFHWFLSESCGISLKEHPFQRIQHEIRMVRYPTDRIMAW